jgi:hypothetical protein
MFHKIKDSIASFDGCLEVNAYPDESGLFCFTVSKWEEAADLEAYRNSPFFKETWTETKKLFSGKAEAWSLMS